MMTPEQLDRLIQQKQEGHQITPENSDEQLIVDLVDLAEHFDLSSDFDARLMQEFQQQAGSAAPRSQQPSRISRIVLTAAASVMLVMVAVFTIPPLQTVAQQIIDFFHPAETNQKPSNIIVGGIAPDDDYDPFPLSMEEVSAQADFDFMVPAFIPETFSFDGAMIQPEDGSVSLNYACSGPWSFSIIQTPIEEDAFDPERIQNEVGADAVIESVKIGSADGQYVRGAWVPVINDEILEQSRQAEEPTRIEIDAVWMNESHWYRLNWYADGILYHIGTSGGSLSENMPASACMPTKEDFIAVANSLAPKE